VNYWTKIWL